MPSERMNEATFNRISASHGRVLDAGGPRTDVSNNRRD